MVEAVRRDPQRHRLGALQAAGGDARAHPAALRSLRAADHAAGALFDQRRRHAEISRLAEDVLADRFRAIDGVSMVNVNGSLKRELSVLLHAQKLREFNVSVTEVVNALQQQNTTAPVGRVKGALDEQSIRLVGRIETPARVRGRGGQAQRGRQHRAPGPGRHRARTASPSSPASACATPIPTWASRITRSRDASTVTVANEVRDRGGRASTRRCRRAPSSRSPWTAARTPRTACTT